MVYSSEEKEKAYQKAYWSKPENRERNRICARAHYAATKAQLVKYWRRKYIMKFNCSEKDCAHLSMEQMRTEIDSGMCSV